MVIVGMVVFVLLNFWFVFPYFGEWGRTKADIAKNRTTLERYQQEIAKRPRYQAREKELETTGSEMLNNENELQRVVQTQAAATGVQIGRSGPDPSYGSKTNQFFQEGGVSIEFNSGGKELVDFLVGIAAQNAMVRVREMNVRPDPSRTRLSGTLVFAGNFQQRPSTNAPPRKVAAVPQTRK